jgi:transcriptional regulator with XRE-family HTH domain
MERVAGVGGRDPLIRRLLEFGMVESSTARLTGVNPPRVEGIATGSRPALTASATERRLAEAGVTKAEVARLAGVSRQMVWRVCRNKSKPPRVTAAIEQLTQKAGAPAMRP